MDNRIIIWIKRAEERWLNTLHNHAAGLFSGTFLPSHDHTHHRRVWNICRSLLTEIAVFNSHMDESLVEGVLIAAYFHDLGMVHSTKQEHGKLGRDICENYFKDKQIEPPSRFEELLDAIERHDIKEERIYSGIDPGNAPDILSILSISDDLEALGIIGVYRYAEIYLQRGIDLMSLGISILENVSTRFNNISKSCINCPGIVKAYRQQYTELVSFYDRYNQQLLLESNPEEVFSGHIGVVNYIRKLSVEGRTGPESYLLEITGNNRSNLVTDFFTRLNGELEKARLDDPSQTAEVSC
ncbi:MAG: HD domain-containing protein [Bacteroidales bacterium]|nr:HD domain-containing protein [Bacteroidales bacterium]